MTCSLDATKEKIARFSLQRQRMSNPALVPRALASLTQRMHVQLFVPHDSHAPLTSPAAAVAAARPADGKQWMRLSEY